MSKHTPGPWKVIETHYLPHDGDHVADMSNGLMVVPCIGRLGDPLADARLIAAAPELLAALQYIVGCSAPMTPQQEHCWPTMRAAIAKATGEQS